MSASLTQYNTHLDIFITNIMHTRLKFPVPIFFAIPKSDLCSHGGQFHATKCHHSLAEIRTVPDNSDRKYNSLERSTYLKCCSLLIESSGEGEKVLFVHGNTPPPTLSPSVCMYIHSFIHKQPTDRPTHYWEVSIAEHLALLLISQNIFNFAVSCLREP